ncbi:hypothetical protein E2C01_098212 [Portunus trituberculatus]|uniref:Uncharacterized protein n=1 Tax=Portunus trituberculatus TaxID=210409 RepID=A0A5B7KBK0_PORTR|nr:hypothetical protein [Portunus trituberculatus]
MNLNPYERCRNKGELGRRSLSHTTNFAGRELTGGARRPTPARCRRGGAAASVSLEAGAGRR